MTDAPAVGDTGAVTTPAAPTAPTQQPPQPPQQPPQPPQQPQPRQPRQPPAAGPARAPTQQEASYRAVPPAYHATPRITRAIMTHT